MDFDEYLNLLRTSRESEREAPAPEIQVPVVSVPAANDDSVRQMQCAQHGIYEARQVRLGGTSRAPLMGWNQCPRCEARWKEDNKRDEARLRQLLPGEPGWTRRPQ